MSYQRQPNDLHATSNQDELCVHAKGILITVPPPFPPVNTSSHSTLSRPVLELPRGCLNLALTTSPRLTSPYGFKRRDRIYTCRHLRGAMCTRTHRGRLEEARDAGRASCCCEHGYLAA